LYSLQLSCCGVLFSQASGVLLNARQESIATSSPPFNLAVAGWAGSCSSETALQAKGQRKALQVWTPIVVSSEMEMTGSVLVPSLLPQKNQEIRASDWRPRLFQHCHDCASKLGTQGSEFLLRSADFQAHVDLWMLRVSGREQRTREGN